MVLFHGSREIVRFPEVRRAVFNKDFYFGFYCPNPALKYLKFEKMTDEWLDFIAACRTGKSHTYDIVEGPMVEDTIFNYVQAFVDGQITRAAFWELAKFNHPTHQISCHTMSALDTLTFMGSEEVYGNKK